MREIPISFNRGHRTEKEKIVKDMPEEVMIQAEVRENLDEMKGSGNRYAWMVVDALLDNKEPSTESVAELLINQKNELPYLVSSVLERACNLQCAHCLYQDEKSSLKISEEAELNQRIIEIVSQMPKQSEDYNPQFLSGGRILRPGHLELFSQLSQSRPDVKLGVIDNGTFVSLLSKWPDGFKFDWMDVSVDGLEDSHNQQRQSSKAFEQAIQGLKKAREVTKSADEGGRVTSLFTLTNINSGDISKVAEMLLSAQEDEQALVDQFCLTTVGPTNSVNRQLETNADDFKSAWEQIKEVSHKYNTETEQKVRFSIYRVQDIEKLAAAVGEERFLQVFTAKEDGSLPVKTGRNFLSLEFDGVEVNYQPLSIWTPEEFLIEADGVYRTAYEGQFTLEELRSGVSRDGRDTTPFSFEKLTAETDFRETYERAVDSYWVNFGKQRLEEEIAVFQRIRDKSNA